MEKLNKTKMTARKIFKILMWAFLILLAVYVVSVAIRIPHVLKEQKTQDQVLKIHNTKLKIEDVEGKNLPTDPGAEADKTLQGIDANNNGIRDDVELAIFKEYPTSAKTRAVLLQYALTLQMIFTQPFVNEEIATAVVQEKSRSYACVGRILNRNDDNEEIMNKYYKDVNNLRSFIEDKQLNNSNRTNYDNSFYKNVRSYSDPGFDCDIDLTKLSN